MLRRWLSRARGHPASRPPADLRSLDRDQAASFLQVREGLPHVDWAMAESWAQRRTADERERDRLRRAVAAAWLDEIRDALAIDHKRWRHALIEGLAPVQDGAALRIARAADHAAGIISDALKPITGRAAFAPLGVIALARPEDYYSLIAPFYPDEGEFATSGGVYINERGWSFPFLAMPVRSNRHSIEQTIAHELTHHALCRLDIPLWAEEGLTQMMEERVTGVANFALDRDTLRRHRRRWEESGLEVFWSGAAFHSPHEDEQELAYHLSQVLVRGLLSAKPAAFFAFTRAATRADHGAAAAAEHLGADLDGVAERLLAGP
jgi:hypothetical protein